MFGIMTGMHHEHGPIGEYRKKIHKPDMHQTHQKILSGRKQWVHERYVVGKARVRDRAAVQSAMHSVTQTSQAGGRFEMPGMEFVFEEDWDESYGEYAPEDVKTEVILGVSRKWQGMA